MCTIATNWAAAYIRSGLAHSIFCGALLLPAMLQSNACGQSSEKTEPKTVILVPPFENQSKYHETISYEVATGNNPDKPKRVFHVDRYTEAPRSLLEDKLGKIDGVSIVERQRVDSILQEVEFGSLSGLVDTEKSIRLGKMLGAKLIVMGTIVDLRAEKRTFKGYGIKTDNTEVLASVRVRLLDIETGKVSFSKVVKGSKTFSSSSFGGTSSSEKYFSAIEAALDELGEDSTFKSALVGTPRGSPTAAASTGEFEVEFAPKPENCDIEIDGKYVGGSPLKRRLSAGKDIKVRISKGGYKSWEGVISPESGLRITRELDAVR